MDGVFCRQLSVSLFAYFAFLQRYAAGLSVGNIDV
jgi:hypothetical protein